MITFNYLMAQALIVLNAKLKKENTARRIGGLFRDILLFLQNLVLGIILKGELANEATIKAISNPTKGDTYRAIDTGLYWCYDGIKWNNIGELIPSDVATKADLANLDNSIEPFITLDVIGCGIYTEIATPYTQGAYYNKDGILTANSYWEYAELVIVPGTTYNLRSFSVGDGTVAPIVLKQETNILRIFNSKIDGVNVIFPSNITSILISRAIGYNAAVGVYERYVESSVFASNNNKTSIFQDADTHPFYKNALLDLKINGITGNEKIWLSAFYNKNNANQIHITDSVTGKLLCNYYNDLTESGIKEVYLEEYQNSGYSGYATINYDLLLNAILPSPLYPRFNNDIIKYDSRERFLSKRIDYFPYAKDIFINGFVPVGMIEGLSLQTLDGANIPAGNFSFFYFKRTETATQVTINNGSTTVCNFWVGSKLTNTQTIKLTQYQNSKIEGYMRINFDLMEIGVAYSNNAYYLDKNRIFNNQLFVDVLNNTSLLSTGLVAKEGKTLLAIGDSLTAALEWQKKIVEMLGMTVRTHAKGGASIISMIDGDSSGWAALSVEDVTGVDYITLFGGYNNRTIPHGNIGDNKESNTIMGMIQYAINRLYDLLGQANNLQCRIVIITPHCGGKYNWCDADGYQEWPKGSGRTLEGMAKAIKEIANYNSLPCIDLWHNSGINKFTWNLFQSSSIPNNDAYTLIGEFDTTNDLPTGTLNDVAKIKSLNRYDNTYVHTGTGFVFYQTYPGSPFPYNADQLHCNALGYAKIGECIARHINVL